MCFDIKVKIRIIPARSLQHLYTYKDLTNLLKQCSRLYKCESKGDLRTVNSVSSGIETFATQKVLQIPKIVKFMYFQFLYFVHIQGIKTKFKTVLENAYLFVSMKKFTNTNFHDSAKKTFLSSETLANLPKFCKAQKTFGWQDLSRLSGLYPAYYYLMQVSYKKLP